MQTPLRLPIRTAAAAALLALGPAAQWSPGAGQWGKLDDAHVRVMTWNVEDGICRTNDKADPTNDWAALARIVAALRPDVLVLQECGDNDGQGTGSGVDSVAELANVLGLFLHGGIDVYTGGMATEHVQAHAPGYDLPYVLVSAADDGFNRNVVLSRFPFQDLNGDGKATLSNLPAVLDTQYVSGTGVPGPRGIPVAELDLPDLAYAIDLVVACCHLKAGSQASDKAERIDSGQRFAYWADHLVNGAGTQTPDPFGKVADVPPAASVIGDRAALVLAGDFNDKVYPADDGVRWASRAQNTDGAGAPDGPDQDRTDLAVDDARDPFTASKATLGASKLDYVTWEDSLVDAKLAFTFHTQTLPPGALPPELATFFAPSSASAIASDHRPVVVDLAFPTADCDGDGVLDVLEPDFDGDGAIDDCDNCPLANPDQADADGDGVGDACQGTWCHPTFGAGSMQLAFCGDAFTTQGAVYFTPVQAPGFVVVSAAKLAAPIPLMPGADALLVPPDVLIPFTTGASPIGTPVLGPLTGGAGPSYTVWNVQVAVLDPTTLAIHASNGVELTLIQ
jgi:endonuclease/exonuclease/phosphatase family metal-dependent hydrolase